MHAQRPSSTAALVACMRALADDGFTTTRGFRDPIAQRLLPRRWSVVRMLMRQALTRARPAQRSRAAAQVDAVALRTLAIDERLEAALARGVRQVVILGAGLDTRAFRLPSLREADVFEVDHPRTQATKARASAALPRLARSLTFVPVDFEHASLGARLAAAGHRRADATAWVWEGVVMYLTAASRRATLGELAAASAPGSVLLLHYNEPAEPSPQTRAMNALLWLWSEPQVGQLPRAAMAAELRDAGLAVAEDTGPAEWIQRHGAVPPEGAIARQSRLLVAHAGGGRP